MSKFKCYRPWQFRPNGGKQSHFLAKINQFSFYFLSGSLDNKSNRPWKGIMRITVNS